MDADVRSCVCEDDISIMYHGIFIPERNLYVHHFLSRNLETNRDPNSYVKTFLTFAPMTRVALKKTTEQ